MQIGKENLMGAILPRSFDVTVTSKGQMTLPAGVRGPLGISAGDRLALTVTEDGEIRMVKKTASFRDSIGMFAHLAKNRTVDRSEETNFSVDAAMLEQEARSKKSRIIPK
jgi:antitoxin PrlF